MLIIIYSVISIYLEGSINDKITKAEESIGYTQKQIDAVTSDITQVKQDTNNKVDKTSNAGAYVNQGDSVVNVPVSNTPTASAIPRYDSVKANLRSGSVDWNTATDDTVVNKSMYEDNFNALFNENGIPNINLSDLGGAFTLDMFFGTTAGEEKTVVLETPTVSETIITQLGSLLVSNKAFSLQGEYSQAPTGLYSGVRIVIINSSLGELNGYLYPPFYCTGILPNKNYPYGLQFSMHIDITTDGSTITIKTKVYEPNSGGSENIETITVSVDDIEAQYPITPFKQYTATISKADFDKVKAGAVVNINLDLKGDVFPYWSIPIVAGPSGFTFYLPEFVGILLDYQNVADFVLFFEENGETITGTFMAVAYTGGFTPETITITLTSMEEGIMAGTMTEEDFNKIKTGVPINLIFDGQNEVGSFVVGKQDTMAVLFTPYLYGSWLVNKRSSSIVALFQQNIARTDTTSTFTSQQEFNNGLTVGRSKQLTINNQGALTITDGNGTVGLSGQGLMYRVGGSTQILKMPTDSVSGTTEIVSKAYLDSQNFLKQENTTGALLTISNDNYIRLRSNVAGGGSFIVGNKTNTLPGFEVLDEYGIVVFDAKSKNAAVDIGTSAARMFFGGGITPESKVVKLFTADNNNILTFGLGNDRLSIDFNGRVLFDIQTTTVSKDFNQVQSGDIAGRLDTGLTDEHIIITSIYDTTNQVEFMQPYYDGTKWYATAICVGQGISGTSNVQIKYIKLP